MSDDSRLVSIKEAAERAGISRRTVERWIAANKLAAVADPGDGRKRLVRVEDVERLLGHPLTAGANARARETPRPVLDPLSAEVIDQTLQLIYSYQYRTISSLAPAAFVPLTMDQLRSGPIGRTLLRLALIAQGTVREPKSSVLTIVESLVQLLFWPAAGDDYTVPRSFWDTNLGRLIAQAKFRAFEPNELITIGNAAQELGVTRPVIYRWMDDRTLNYVRDDASGRVFVVRRDIEHLQRFARELTHPTPAAHDADGTNGATDETGTS